MRPSSLIYREKGLPTNKHSEFAVFIVLDAMTTVEMRVHMDCAGCEIKIRKALQRLQGVDSIDIDMRMQKVTVTGHAEPKKVLKTVRKTGRRAELWPSPYNTDHAYMHHYHHHQYQPPHAASRTSSSYNYYKHGYDGHMHGYYHGPPRPSFFSDENPHACSIM